MEAKGEYIHEHEGGQCAPKIVYASRTHLQLQQVHNEIKRLPYSNLKVLQLASRDKLCINEDIDKEDFSGKLLSQKCMEVTNLVRHARLHNYHQRTIENDAKIEIPDNLKGATKFLKDVPKSDNSELKPC